MEKILILDFGSQYTQLIARRIRELQVFSEIKPCTVSVDSCNLEGLKGLILSGGPSSVLGSDAPGFDPRWLNTDVPILGICYGMQLLAHHHGAQLETGLKREYGLANLEIKRDSDLFFGLELGEKTPVWMSHGDHVETLPEGYQLIGSSESLAVAAISSQDAQRLGIQFHPEVVHTKEGTRILRNYVERICSCKMDWTASNFIQSSTEQIQKQVAGGKKVICGLSGGVDSSVAAVLVDQAIHEQLICIFVDNGLLRENEGDQVEQRLGPDGFGLNLIRVNAQDRFLRALEGVTEPEEKRKIIGNLFIEVFEEEAEKISNIGYLVQGTLYPDVIESVSVRGPSATIKTHHNVGGLPEKMNLELIEPFRELFKDEVRSIGRELGLPEKLIQRQPFPGPGLAVRCLGEINRENLEMLRAADRIFQDEIRAAKLYEKLWQSFAVLLPVRSVGVMGDDRTYEQAIALRAVTSQDGMTADWYYLPEELLKRSSNRIINEVPGINRVVLDISSKPPATIEWE